eukprot:3601410-Rhodomonas_salina.2
MVVPGQGSEPGSGLGGGGRSACRRGKRTDIASGSSCQPLRSAPDDANFENKRNEPDSDRPAISHGYRDIDQTRCDSLVLG